MFDHDARYLNLRIESPSGARGWIGIKWNGWESDMRPTLAGTEDYRFEFPKEALQNDINHLEVVTKGRFGIEEIGLLE